MSVTELARPMAPHLCASIRRHAVALGMIGVSVLFYTATALVTGQHAQLTFAGFMGLSERTVALGFVAIGQTVVIARGAIDLSVANLVSLSAVLAAYFMQNDPANIAEATAIVVLVSAGVGALNGLLVGLLGVSPLIATLGSSLVLQGILSVAYAALQGAVPKAFQFVAYGTFGALPLSVLGLLAVAGLTAFALVYTRIGSRLFAVGGNPRAARLAGIHGTYVTIWAFAFSGLMCALAGLYLAGRLGTGTPWIGRDGNYDLGSIAAVVIGGTLLAGGRASVAGTLAGVLVFATTDAMFNMLQIDPFLGQILRGGIVIAAVAVYTYGRLEETA
ncbi:ABC transporter permease [Sinorhizobium medicae]|uniref:ABC transporter permease n=1 Tax=Sinorhizobium medicae TaxID=110321 RepID=UPI000FDA3D84|nr:ABC transporter permease [Sinorhizobium medicae]MDW9500525.1 ABC transporter permease [Sinorhizobium meliloti]RVH85872.1 ABC transporter permease [Sinorhizobium medicae]RVP59990.1 ABC transporter permease [Sinorhizobium medicae]